MKPPKSVSHTSLLSRPQHGGEGAVPPCAVADSVAAPALLSPEDHRSLSGSDPCLHGGSETILLVEDDTAIRNLCTTLLRDRGYHVVEAKNGEEALAVAETIDRIDLLVTDLVMPRMGGEEVARRLRAAQPDLRVLFVSGYNESGVQMANEVDWTIRFLRKPFRPLALMRAARELLDLPSPASR